MIHYIYDFVLALAWSDICIHPDDSENELAYVAIGSKEGTVVIFE
jgi:hypothetical protein